MGEFIKIGGSGGSGGSTTFDGLADKATVDLPVVNTPLATALSGKEDTTNKKTDVDANKTSDVFFPTVKAVFDWVSGLFVKGAASSTNNAIARFDGATGKLVKNSSVTLKDDGSISSKDLVDKLIDNKVNAIYLPTFDEIRKYLKENMKSGDIILTIGAGNITHLSDKL